MFNLDKEVMLAIEWGIVPLILFGMLTNFLIYTPPQKYSTKIKNSCSSGKFAGLIIFALFILSQKNRELIFSLNMPEYEFNILIVVFSMVSGAIFSWFFDLVKKRIFIGLYTLISIASTNIAIYCYLFIQNSRSYLIFITMGVILGILIYTIFFPKETPPEDKDSQYD